MLRHYFILQKRIVQELIHNLKYKGHEEIGAILGEWYAEDLKRLPYCMQRNYSVPLHPEN
jgi:predicted amidophosphoribosyltransferase